MSALHQMVPSASVVAHLVNPTYPPTQTNVSDVAAAARVLGLQIILLEATTENEINAAFAAIIQKRAGALLVGVAGEIRSWCWQHATPFLQFLSSASLRWRGA